MRWRSQFFVRSATAHQQAMLRYEPFTATQQAHMQVHLSAEGRGTPSLQSLPDTEASLFDELCPESAERSSHEERCW